jgi:hypothetical protein
LQGTAAAGLDAGRCTVRVNSMSTQCAALSRSSSALTMELARLPELLGVIAQQTDTVRDIAAIMAAVEQGLFELESHAADIVHRTAMVRHARGCFFFCFVVCFVVCLFVVNSWVCLFVLFVCLLFFFPPPRAP